MKTLPTINGVKLTRRAVTALGGLARQDMPYGHWAFSGDRQTPDILERARLAQMYEVESDRPYLMLRITDEGRRLAAER